MRCLNGGHSSSEVRSEVSQLMCQPGQPKQEKSLKYVQLRTNTQQLLNQNSLLGIDFKNVVQSMEWQCWQRVI